MRRLACAAQWAALGVGIAGAALALPGVMLVLVAVIVAAWAGTRTE